jgi:hypothetical protein
LVIETMEGGVDVTINGVEGGHGREEGGEEWRQTITLSRGCSKPSAIDTKSKGSGQRIVCRMKTQCGVNTNEQQSTADDINWICKYFCRLSFR